MIEDSSLVSSEPDQWRRWWLIIEERWEEEECCQSALFALFTAENEWSITRHYYQRDKAVGCTFEVKTSSPCTFTKDPRTWKLLFNWKLHLCRVSELIIDIRWVRACPSLTPSRQSDDKGESEREREREKVLIVSDWSIEIGRKRKIATSKSRHTYINTHRRRTIIIILFVHKHDDKRLRSFRCASLRSSKISIEQGSLQIQMLSFHSSYAPVLVNSKSNSSDWSIGKVWITMERAVMDRMVSSPVFNHAAHSFVSAFVTPTRISTSSIDQCRWTPKNVPTALMKRPFSVETPLISLVPPNQPIGLCFHLNSAGW